MICKDCKRDAKGYSERIDITYDGKQQKGKFTMFCEHCGSKLYIELVK